MVKNILPHGRSLITLFVPLLGLVLGIAAEPDDTNYDESKVPFFQLPPLFENNELAPKEQLTVWKNSRRSAIQRLLEQHVYGSTPDLGPLEFRTELIETDSNALNGEATRKQVRVIINSERKLKIDILIYLPNNKNRSSSCFVGLNFYGNQTVHSDPQIAINEGWMRGNREIGIQNNRATPSTRGVYQERWQVNRLIRRGYALATAYCGDIDPDNYRHDFTDGVHPLFYRPGQTKPEAHEWGAIGAWAWGLSRILDYLLESEPSIHPDRIGVIGHSRLGKTALWAGAQDTRFGLVISNNSGCGGAALYRRQFGERIHHMIKPVGYWFCGTHAAYANREATLPVDQHMLLALIAPRPLYVASATKDQWADPKGEFLAAAAASPAYQIHGLVGLPTDQFPEANHPIHGTIGYHVREGDHAVTAYDWDQYLDFADHHFSRFKP